jgi:hypothetical protein
MFLPSILKDGFVRIDGHDRAISCDSFHLEDIFCSIAIPRMVVNSNYYPYCTILRHFPLF